MSKRILLMCTMPETRPALIKILGQHYELVFCYRLADAIAALDTQNIAAVGCGVHFDDGNAFDLLRLMRANPRTSLIPFFTASAAGRKMLPNVEQALEIATRALGGNGTIPLVRWQRELGDEHAAARLRELIAKAIREREND